MSLFVESEAVDNAERSRLPPGIDIIRRQFLFVSLAGLATLSTSTPRHLSAHGALSTNGDLDWNSFAAKVMPSALRAIASNDPTSEEQYLSDLSVLTRRLNEVPEAGDAKTFSSGVTHARCFNQYPLMVTQFRLAPNAAIPFHDHRDYNGVLCVIEGQVLIRSFDIVGPDRHPASGTTFQIRETRKELLDRGQSSSLSRIRDNIHDVRATEQGATLIDFFTFFAPHGKSVYLAVGSDLFDATPDILEATWSE